MSCSQLRSYIYTVALTKVCAKLCAPGNWDTSPESTLIGQQDFGVEDQRMFLHRVGGGWVASEPRPSPFMRSVIFTRTLRSPTHNYILRVRVKITDRINGEGLGSEASGWVRDHSRPSGGRIPVDYSNTQLLILRTLVQFYVLPRTPRVALFACPYTLYTTPFACYCRQHLAFEMAEEWIQSPSSL